MPCLVSGSRKIPDNHPVLSVRVLLFFLCCFLLVLYPLSQHSGFSKRVVTQFLPGFFRFFYASSIRKMTFPSRPNNQLLGIFVVWWGGWSVFLIMRGIQYSPDKKTLLHLLFYFLVLFVFFSFWRETNGNSIKFPKIPQTINPKTSPWIHLGLMWGFFIYLREGFFNHHNFFQKSLGWWKGVGWVFFKSFPFVGFLGYLLFLFLLVENTKTLLWIKKIPYVSLH